MYKNKQINKTVFLDRDGVINQDSPDYIKTPSEFIFIPGSIDAIKTLTLNNFDVIIITNQSAINRQMISTNTLENIFFKMKTRVQQSGGKIKDIFYCPHKPDDNCDCRKPKPGMILKAQKKHHIDLSKSIMVGDSAKDIECSIAAGCGFSALVRTGIRTTSEKALIEKNIHPDYIGNDLFDVVNWIIKTI